MDWINPEAFGLGCPLLANEFIRGQALERLESSAEVVGIDEMFSGGVMCPGLHPNCRCVLISVADEDSEVFSEDVEPIIT